MTPPSDQNKIKKVNSTAVTADIMENADIGVKLNVVLSSLANLSKKFNTLETSLSDKIDVTNQNLTSITQEIQAAKEDRLNIHKTVDELKLDVQTLKAQPLPPNIAEIMEKMKTEMRADIMKEVKDEMNTIRETQHKNQLMEDMMMSNL